MPNDKYGIKMLYPTISGDNIPKSWFSDSGWEDGPRIRLDENVSGNNTDGYRLNDNSKVRLTVSADSKDVDIECDNDFTKSTLRGYVYKANDWMGKSNSGVEMTGYFKMSQIDQSDDTVKGNPIIFKGPTGEHHSNTDCCSGSSHMVHISGMNEDWDNDIAMRFSKEMWHVHYITRSDYKALSGETNSFLDMGWVGFKYVIYKKTVNNVKSVVIETWINNNADKQSWKKVISTTDTGGWGNGGGECNGNSDDRLAFGNARMMWRWDHRDGNDLRFKWLSIRPVDPFGDFDEDPVNPPTNTPTVTTFRSNLKLQRNINSAVSLCDFGGLVEKFEIANSATYIERKLADHVDQSNRTIIAERANPAGGSGMVGDIPKEFHCILRKEGTPASTVRAKIWDTAGVEKYASVNTITATTLNTSFSSYSIFDMSTNTYAMQNGDRIGVQYTQSDPDNCVVIKCRDPGDGSTGSYYGHYSGGVWGDITSRDVICIVWG